MNYKVIERFRKRRENISTFVRASATSTCYHDSGPENLITGNYMYHSKEGNGTYAMLVFRYPIYADKLITVSAKNRDPRYWVFEGSNDGINFVELKKNEGQSLCGNWGVFDKYTNGCTSIVTKEHELKNKGYYNLFRFMIYGLSSDNKSYFLVLKQLEIIGRIDTKCYFNTCRARTACSSFPAVIFIIISRSFF